jgi:hypothetical protein
MNRLKLVTTLLSASLLLACGSDDGGETSDDSSEEDERDAGRDDSNQDERDAGRDDSNQDDSGQDNDTSAEAGAADDDDTTDDAEDDDATDAEDAGTVGVEDGGTEPSPDDGGATPDEPVIAEWPEEGVTLIELDADGHAELSSTLVGAPTLDHLDWAKLPAVACWQDDNTTDEFFSAEHQAFALAEVVPEWSEVTITITPAGNNEANLYAIEMPVDQADVAPEISDATFCSVPVQMGSPGEPSTITLRTYAHDSHILFGVSHRGRFNAGDFNVEVEVSQLDGADRCYADVEQPYKYPSNVQLFELDGESKAVISGNLSAGAPVCDNEFLVETTCAPATRSEMFGGNHVFYAIDGGIDDHTVLNVTVTPDPGVDVSLYSALQGTTSFYVPPNFLVANCDGAYHATFPGAPSDENPGESESLLLNAINNPYNVFFAVAGTTQQGASGGYTISVQAINTSTSSCDEADIDAVLGLDAWPSSVETIQVETSDGEGSASVTGALADGAEQCTLDWASNSSVACFPATENDYFAGNHVMYALDEPPAPGSQVAFRVIPQPGVEVSAYAYRIGTQNYLVPPFVPSVVQCEASYPLAIGTPTNPGVVEEVSFYGGSNAYNYFLGVAGYRDGEASGEFEVQVEITEPPPPHCPESLPGATYAAWPSNVELIDLNADGEATASGDLGDGRCVNLSWAENSSVACFPATRFEHFEGNHVQYALSEPLPPNSEVTITVTPRGNADVNLYGFQTGTNSFPVPPNVPSVPVCEASYPFAVGTPENPGEAESIYFANPTDGNEYNISFVIASNGSGDHDDAEYDIEIVMNTAEPHCEESLPGDSDLDAWPSSVTSIELDADGNGSVSGDLSSGSCMNLGWAENSSVACYPSTRFDRFQGSHVMYALEEPIPPNSVLSITLTPDDDVDANLYGFQIGADSFMVPPAVPSVVSCEASYPSSPYGGLNPGEQEKIYFYNPSDSAAYNIFFAVAGPTGVDAGGYELDVHLVAGTTHCEESLPGQQHNSWPGSVTQLPGAGDYSGDLASGSCVNLAFASDSSVACFPATQNENFEGSHVMYALEVPGASSVDISLTSASDSMNLYGMMIGDDSHYVPPYVPNTIFCEASLPPFDNPEDDTIHFENTLDVPRNLLFVVAGESGVDSGAFDVSVELDSL